MEQNKRSFKGIWIPAEIWLSEDLKVMEKLFLVEIDSLDNDLNGCYANNNYFAKFFGLSKNRCSEIIKSLKDKGYLTINYTYAEGTKQIDKRFMKVTKKYFAPSDFRETPSENRLTPSEKCEDNNTVNNTNNNIIYVVANNKTKDKIDYEAIREKYNNIKGNRIAQCKSITNKRKKQLNARINEYGIDAIYKVLDNINESDFLKNKFGLNTKDQKSKLDFDWIFNPNNFIKILEDKYKDKQTKQVVKEEFNLLG